MKGCSADRNPLAGRFQVDQRDWCQKEFQENDVQTKNKNREIKELSSLIETSWPGAAIEQQCGRGRVGC